VAGDLREPVRVGPQAALVVLAVDTSGSMGAAERAAGARQAARGLLVDAYQRRDRVGVVTFRGTGAEVVLRPTSSTEVAAARLASLPTGGRTPLGEGLRAAGELLAAGQRRGLRPVLVVVSDGRATWAPDGRDPVEDALDAARTLARRGVSALVVDCEGPRAGLGLAENLAQALEARRVTPAGAGGAELAGSVAAGLRGLAPGPGGSR
jgi:magnesium chelatase subunit D